MKEQYVKPLIVYENFSLTQNIAIDCGDTHDSTLGQSNHLSPDTCNWIQGEGDDAVILFYVDQCEDSVVIGDPEPGDELDIEGYCYNNPDGGVSLFSSM